MPNRKYAGKVLPVIACCAATALHAASGPLLDDATVQVQLPGNNFGGLPQLQVGQSSRAYLRFSVAELPLGTTAATVRKAVVRLFVNRVVTPGDLDLHRVDNPWSEKTITFANAPVLPTAQEYLTVASSNSFVSVEVTKLVQLALANGQASFSFALTARGAAEVFIDSKENTSTSQAASLDIELTGPQGPQGIPGANGAQGPMGPQGPKGDTGGSTVIGSLSTFQVSDRTLESFSSDTFYLSCPAGYPQLVSGGCGMPFHQGTFADGAADIKYYYSGPSVNKSNSEWQCAMSNAAFTARVVRLYVQCAK